MSLSPFIWKYWWNSGSWSTQSHTSRHPDQPKKYPTVTTHFSGNSPKNGSISIYIYVYICIYTYIIYKKKVYWSRLHLMTKKTWRMWFFTRFGSFWNRGQTSKFSFNNFTPGLLASAVEFPPGFWCSAMEVGNLWTYSFKPGFLAGVQKSGGKTDRGCRRKTNTRFFQVTPFGGFKF